MAILDDERMARFWRWAVQQDADDPHVEDFIADTVELLYSGADLKQLEETIAKRRSEAQAVYDRLRREFGFEHSAQTAASRRLGFMAGQIKVPRRLRQYGRTGDRRNVRGERHDFIARYPSIAVAAEGRSRTVVSRIPRPFSATLPRN